MKRIEIATVLAKKHKLCIFDEPEAGIDLWSFSMLIQQFEEVKKDKEQSIIIISHQERIIQMADRVMVIEDGRIAGVGEKRQNAAFADEAGSVMLFISQEYGTDVKGGRINGRVRQGNAGNTQIYR